MKSTPLIINWHDQNAPIYSAHFEPHGKGRLATAGGDNNVRLWKVDSDGENRSVEYLATLVKHTQAVNVVRWCPKGELLASAGDDGNVILWVPSESHHPTFGNDGIEDKESWRTKHMCRSSGAEIYDLAWSPDGLYFIIGSMDNIARIYHAATGAMVRQIAEHSHYVQGVAWDPLNEYLATQSSDRSVSVYSLKNRDGQYTLSGGGLGAGAAAGLDDGNKPTKIASHAKADLPPRRLAPQSPAPSMSAAAAAAAADLSSHRAQLGAALDNPSSGGGSGGGGNPASMICSPVPSTPGTPTSFALPMNPPSIMSHSRRSSFSSRRSVSPAPSAMPLPAVMPMEPSPKLQASKTSAAAVGMMKNASLYANETLTSFFRRLTFTPDGSLLLTPAGQYQTHHWRDGGAGAGAGTGSGAGGTGASGASSRPVAETTNTVFIYSRAGINKAPIAHLPGHKKPSVAVRCSPVVYTLRQGATPPTKHITIDTSSSEEPIPALPAPLSGGAGVTSTPTFMEPPPPPHSDAASAASANSANSAATPGPKPLFALPHRMVYAVATQDAVLLYDTQQHTPLCVVSNLHCATFTDLAWAADGLTLLISSSDGFCSTLSFAPGELGTPFTGDLAASASGLPLTGAPKHAPPTPLGPLAASSSSSSSSSAGGGGGGGVGGGGPPSPYRHVHRPPPPPPPTSHHHHHHRHSASSLFTAPSPPATTTTTTTSAGGGTTPSMASLAALSAAATPPATPRNRANSGASSVAGSVGATVATVAPAAALTVPPAVAGTKRDASESEQDDGSGDSGGVGAQVAGAPVAVDGNSSRNSNTSTSGQAEPAKKRRIAPTLVGSHEG